MQGFKSFADKVTIELTDGITCIVGPNGSGKSNISDALRWVLGEQSSKQLRGGKMDDMIFAGTSTRRARGMAEVTLVIDNCDKEIPIEYNEVAIRRRMYRSGENEYSINGNQCRLRDIRELFMDTGIGVEGYSIIGQGRISELINSKPEERMKIFEEAAGVAMYRTRKAEAERKLHAASENLERVRDIISEIEGRIDGLREEETKARKYIKLRDRYKYLSVNIILHDLKSIERNVEKVANEMEAITSSYDILIKKGKSLEDEAESQRAAEDRFSEERGGIKDALIEKINELNTLNSNGKLDTQKISTIEERLDRLAASLENNKAKLRLERSKLEDLEAKEYELNLKSDEAGEKLRSAVITLNEHVSKLSVIDEQIEKNKNNIIDLNNANNGRRAEINTLTSYLGTLGKRREEIISEYKSGDEKGEDNRNRLRQTEDNLRKKEKEISEINVSAENVEEKLRNLDAKKIELKNEDERNLIYLNTSRARKRAIEELENRYEGYNNAVRELMNRGFDSVIGTVSDLIDVPTSYETAIETALGSHLQDIVCEDDFAAKKAVNWLKSSRAGRATFLPVTSITAGKRYDIPHYVTESDGYIGVAADKINCDKKFAAIAEYLLGRTIIADNMDDAIKISKERIRGFRIVTLEGEVINSSGAITGGRYKHKGSNILERKREIEKLASGIASAEEMAQRLETELTAADNRRNTLKKERTRIYDSLQQLEIERNLLKNDIAHLSELTDAEGESAQKYERDIANIKEDINGAKNLISKYEREINEAEQARKKAETDTESLIEASEKYHKEIEKDNELITECRISLSTRESDKLGNNELIERVRDTVTDIVDAIDSDSKESDELNSQRDLLLSTGEESVDKRNALQEEREHLELRLREIDRLQSDNRRAQDLNSKARSECNAEISNLQDRRHKLEIRETRLDTISEAQKDKLWDEFEMSYAEAATSIDPEFGITAGNKEIKEVKIQLAELGEVNIGSIEEYNNVSRRYEFMSAQEADTKKAMGELNDIISGMDRTINRQFKENFNKISINFENTFAEMFGGGIAELRIGDEGNPLGAGVEIIAQPPGKKLKNINLMSGGEKTLTGIALMFAVLQTKPTPFVILDEVEAALDDANIERFGKYLDNFSGIQFALITHQRGTMSHADVLYGVTMPEKGVSSLLSLRLEDNNDEYIN